MGVIQRNENLNKATQIVSDDVVVKPELCDSGSQTEIRETASVAVNVRLLKEEAS